MISHSTAIRQAVATLDELYPGGWTVEDLRTAVPDVPGPVLDATLASWASIGRLRVVGEEPARHRSSKGRKVKVFSSALV